MSEETKSPEGGIELTKKELNQINFRWLWGSQLGWNYERMQGPGFAYAIMPMLKRLYTNKEDLAHALTTHLQFFNTTPDMGHIVVGAAVALESKEGRKGEEAVTAIKTGLMGPFAAIGDTLVGVIFGTIFGAIAAYMAVESQSPIGAIIWILVSCAEIGLRLWTFQLGYSQGSKLVTTLGGKLALLTESLMILGATVVGAMCATLVNVKTPLALHFGDVAAEGEEAAGVTISVQDQIFDAIMPKLLPAVLVFFCFWALGRKGMNSTKLIFIVLAIGLVLGGLFYPFFGDAAKILG